MPSRVLLFILELNTSNQQRLTMRLLLFIPGLDERTFPAHDGTERF